MVFRPPYCQKEAVSLVDVLGSLAVSRLPLLSVPFHSPTHSSHTCGSVLVLGGWVLGVGSRENSWITETHPVEAAAENTLQSPQTVPQVVVSVEVTPQDLHQ